ncbi:MAG: hypothetical protein JSU05_11500 [Bacteroidetes bacterium]|nr:hypothetical protein [Bacteroidota bacterium]
MKQVLKNKSIIAIALFILSSVAFMPAAKATDVKDNVPVELKYLGVFKSQPLFQLNFVNTSDNKEYTVTIKDDNGVILYQDNFKSSIANKKFLLDTDDLGAATVRFEVTDRKTKNTVAYEIYRNAKVVEETTISKL